MKQLINLKNLLVMLCVMLGGANVWGQESQVLFHETFGDNSSSARNWSDSYSVKSGVEDVYSGVTKYTVVNAKQGKNTTGQTKSGLNQSSQGTDASIIIGPLNTANCSSMVLSYYWKAGSIKGTYSSSAYYATSSGGTYTKLGDASNGATTFVKQSFDMPIDAQVNTLYLKIVWNTSNTSAIIDEVDLSGVYTTDPSAPQKPASPTFSLAEGTYYENQTLEITTTVENGTIYYTTDGTDPTISATKNTYSSALTISETTTIKACVKDSEGNFSDVVSRTYTIVPSIKNTKETALTTAEAIALIDNTSSEQLAAEKVYVKGTISKVDSYNTTYKSITYWLDDDAFEVYSGKNLKNDDFSAKTDIEVGAQVIVYGNLKKHNATYELDKNNYLVEYTAPAAKAIKSVEITGTASKTTYEKGETFNRSGLTLTVTYEDDTTLDVTSDATWTVTPETLNEIGATQVTVTATYKEYAPSKSIDVTVTAPQPAALPFSFDDGKSAISTTQGMDQTGLGNDYGSTPKLKFDSSNDELVIYYNAPASYLGYTIKGNGFSGGTFSVMESVDGVNYTNVATYTKLTQVNTACMNALKSASRYVKFVYTEKNAGNVALGKIEISADKAPVTVSAAGYATYYNSAKAYTLPAGCEGHVFSDGNLQKIYDAGNAVPANEPLVIKAEAGTYALNFTTTEKESWKSAGMNDLEGTDEETALPADDNYYFYALSLNSEGELSSVGFYWMNETGAAFTNGAHKAYLKLAKSNGAAVKGFAFNDLETAIQNVEANTACGTLYDLSGRKVNKVQKGIYIINGKKVVK